MQVDWKRALTYLRADADYKHKLLYVAGLSIVPIVNFVIFGYGVNIYRNLIKGKEDKDLQPAWDSNSGDFMIKGGVCALIWCGYFLICSVLLLLGGVVFGAGALKTFVTGEGLAFGPMLKIYTAVVVFLCGSMFWSSYTLYAESLELLRAFRFFEVVMRLKTLGKPFLVSLLSLMAFVGLVVWVASFLPHTLGGALCSVCSWMSALVFVHVLAQISQEVIHPVLSDIVDEDLMNYSEKVRSSLDETDEYGYAKTGGYSASHYVDHRAETQLTWSTDSDKSDDDYR